MRFYTKPHKCYCGLDLHARTMSLCIFKQDGEILLHRNMKAAPEPFLQAIAPYREDLVVCVECVVQTRSVCASDGNKVTPRGQRLTAPGRKLRKKAKSPLLGRVCLLTTGDLPRNSSQYGSGDKPAMLSSSLPLHGRAAV
jgi:hypothetical protein